MQNRTQIGNPKCTGSMNDVEGQAAQISEPQELNAAKALIELAYGRLPSSSNKQNTYSEISHPPVRETAKRAEIKKGKRKVEDKFPLSMGTKKNKEVCSLSIILGINGDHQHVDQLDHLKLKLGLQKKTTNEIDLPKKEKNSSSNKPGSGFIPATLHSGIWFPIVHLLSSVRAALIFPHTKYYAIWYNKLRQYQGLQNQFDPDQERNLSLRINQIITLVRLRPGDLSILEIKEPLQDLVKGVLKIFSSKTGPVAASKWSPLTAYDKTNRTWSWVGPIPTNHPHNDCVKEGIFSQAWGISGKTITKMVSCFAKWFIETEEGLQKINTLPPPPITLMQPYNADERLKDAKAVKRHSTINPSPDEVRQYFQMEEKLRYEMTERVFRYTALDGKKNTVAPLRRGSGKPTVKGREHFLLKTDRPPKFTLLCLVRDAAARLPSCIGTRADICILARDSQYINDEEALKSEFNEAVGGGLDRLSFEDDPCVRFDWGKQVWVYLHGDNEDEDFEYVGSASGKRRKRRRRDNTSRAEN